MSNYIWGGNFCVIQNSFEHVFIAKLIIGIVYTIYQCAITQSTALLFIPVFC